MRRRSIVWSLLLIAGMAWGAGSRAWAKIQFDVFPGYDTTARAGAWYPVGVEIFNDGPGFNGIVELDAGQGPVRIPLELPTNTRKRFSVPLFNPSRNFLSVDGRLFDDRGKLREEQTAKRVTVQGWEVPLLGALPGSFAGAPGFPEVTQQQAGWQPRVARLQPELFPDSPVALEGLNSLYLNTARALELKEPQVRALQAWVHGGGQLIVAVDQPADVNATPWLRALMPATLEGVAEAPVGAALQDWVRSGVWDPQFAYKAVDPLSGGVLRSGGSRRRREAGPSDPFGARAPDSAVAAAPIPILKLRLRDGQVALGTSEQPLMVEAPRGRGQVVLLAFNPEREPLKSWTQRPWFFARLADVPPTLLASEERQFFGGRGLDSVFGAMIETRQVRKLPVGFLLLLLLAYLVVIGPFDQWWLKRINRPMLTWITFPIYVALFSGLIYVIGYKLRAGVTEWNELHIVDVLPQGDGSRAALRGWSFGSLYSPANDTYPLGSDLPVATLRGEFRGLWGVSGDPARMNTTVRAQGFDAEMFVPVWSSAMAVSDWEDAGDAPLVARALGGSRLELQNASGRPLGPVWILTGDRWVQIPELPSGATREVEVSEGRGGTTGELVGSWDGRFQAAISQREDTFGGGERLPIDDWAQASVAASLPSTLQSPNGSYVWPAGFDLSPLLRRGDSVVLAWLPDTTLEPALNRFQAARSRKGTLIRLAVPPAP
ncbi:MAG: hypothetical protein J0L84_18965 [Verrucomicrobia bacterium]|nr:hypothetical protein [Verrucomicrobiota bacterium]